ncbi:MAG: peptidyl-prolyl cis-trans isomerase [Nitrospirales bacterium]|nr:peptidyl-prolyl cis-trans isomerase [Nitrospirales bacterium]
MSRLPLFRRFVPWSAGLMLWITVLCPPTASSFQDRIIAVVNKDVITWSDLQSKIQDEYKRLKAKYSGEDLNRRYEQKQREVLNNLIDERLQLQEAGSKGFTVTDEEMNAALQRTPLLPTQTEQDYRDQLLLKKLFDFEVRRTVVVEEEELRRFYNANQSLFLKPPQVRLKQILLTTTEEYQRELARKKAESIFSTWKPNMELEELASQFSEPVKQLGWLQADELLSTLSPEIQNLKPGDLSTPIETPLGLHLLMVEEKSDTQIYPFEAVEQEIRDLLQRQKTEEAYRNWLSDLKKKAFVDVKF